MTRPVADYFKAMDLLDAGTGIPRSTIRSGVERGPSRTTGHLNADGPSGTCPHVERAAALPAYAYLLGLYLGDGLISTQPRS